jgi:transcriptional regulator with XRE-family HTH domain
MNGKIGPRLKDVRLSLGYTQLEFSRTTGIPRSTYTKFELGKNIPKDVYLNCICDRHNINQEWLMTGVGPMFREDRRDVVQAKLVDVFRKATPEAREQIFAIAEIIAGKM